MTATFGSSGFVDLGDGAGSSVSYGSVARGRRFHLDGGNKIKVHHKQPEHHLETEAACSGAELTALRALIGTTDVLSLSTTTAAALLQAISPARIFAHDVYRVKLSFRLAWAYHTVTTTAGGAAITNSGIVATAKN